MKKSAKLSLTLALMMGITGGVQLMNTNTASAEISDKFRMEVNGVIGYINDQHRLGGYNHKSDDSGETSYSNSYTRLQLNYYQDKNVKYQFRLHSDYESLGTNYHNLGSTGSAYFDQSFLEIKDPAAKMVYTLGKKGAFLGQGLIHNSTGNLSGVQVSFGNWYDPQCFQILAGRKKNGDNFLALNETHNFTKNWQLSATYIHHDHPITYTPYYKVGNRAVAQDWKKSQLHLGSVGSKLKMPGVTFVTEYVYNFSKHNGNGANDAATRKTIVSNRASDRRGWFVELYTGPTSDMTSGLPLQKPGTSVWSLKYQDVGANATDAHNPTFFDDAQGWRLNYGHVFRKGLSADIAIARMRDKGGNNLYKSGALQDPHNGEWKNYVMAEVEYKFR